MNTNKKFYVYEGTTCTRCKDSGIDPEIHNHVGSRCLFCDGEGETLTRINLVEAIRDLVDRGALQIVKSGLETLDTDSEPELKRLGPFTLSE